MRILLLVAFQSVALITMAGSVSWDTFVHISDKTSTGCEVMAEGVYYPDGGYYNPAIIMTLTYFSGGVYSLTTFDYTETAAGFIGNWKVARQGDVVSADTIRGQGEYLNHCKLDGEIATTSDYIGKTDGNLYLMFAVADVYSHIDGQLDENVLYGWIELEFNDGILELKHSAIGLDGQSMTVGSIPEPSSALLLLLGLSALSLRRQSPHP